MSIWNHQEEFLMDRKVQPHPRVLEGLRLEKGRQQRALEKEPEAKGEEFITKTPLYSWVVGELQTGGQR